jgi:uncharacterized protein (TIGR02300 family)
MPTKTADIKAQRGTKRTCQNSDCGSRFYDLNHDPITCPACGTVYEFVLAKPAPASTARTYQRPVKREAPAPDDIKTEGDELPQVEGEDELVEAESDETLIEEAEEEAPDVTGIIDAPIEPDEKT